MKMMGIQSNAPQDNYTTWQVLEEYIPKRQLVEYRNRFSFFDRQNTGVLRMEDVALILKELGHSITVNELEHVLHHIIGADFRKTSINVVDFQEFIAIISLVVTNCVAEDEMHLVFRQFDLDGDGYITADELRTLLSRLGDEVTDSEINKMMKAADTDGDGRVSYQEFIRVMTDSADTVTEKPPSSDFASKDFNMNNISAESDANREGGCGLARRRERDQTDSDLFTKGSELQSVKHRRSWFSKLSGKRKSLGGQKKPIESRYSCPALLGSYEQSTLEHQEDLEQKFSSSTGRSSFRLGPFKRKSKRSSQ